MAVCVDKQRCCGHQGVKVAGAAPTCLKRTPPPYIRAALDEVIATPHRGAARRRPGGRASPCEQCSTSSWRGHCAARSTFRLGRGDEVLQPYIELPKLGRFSAVMRSGGARWCGISGEVARGQRASPRPSSRVVARHARASQRQRVPHRGRRGITGRPPTTRRGLSLPSHAVGDDQRRAIVAGTFRPRREGRITLIDGFSSGGRPARTLLYAQSRGPLTATSERCRRNQVNSAAYIWAAANVRRRCCYRNRRPAQRRRAPRLRSSTIISAGN